MKAAGEARKGWARPRSGWPSAAATPGGIMARGGAVASLILALAVLACAAIGLTETQHNGSGLAAEQHAALQAAVG
ncbi:MAG: hypothetical protein WBE51_11735, partial [Xanthobacteraceae bacterium]